jgi:hypothetical protein
VSQVDRDRIAEVGDELLPEDRAWLEEQLTTYRNLHVGQVHCDRT